MKSNIRFPPDVTYSHWLRFNRIPDSRDAWNFWCEHYFTTANMFPSGPARQSCYDSGYIYRFCPTMS